MNAAAPAPEPLPATDGDTAQPRLWRRWMEHPWFGTARGLLVLVAIVGVLMAIDRLGGSSGELGPLDGRSPEVGEPAPLFALREPAGDVRRLSDFRGDVVWINFWASWCGPCRRELPDIQRLSREFEAQGLVVLALNLEESSGKANSFWEELDLDLPILLDSDGEVAEQYRLRGLPDNFFIDRDGTLSGFDFGFLTEGQMRERLAAVGLGP
jgi:peroxiredoxin